jgi:acid stress chaperone HdeA
MRIVPLLAAAALASAALPALAATPTKPLSKWTCEDFLQIDESYRPKVVYWATAYGKGGKPESTAIDIEGTEKVVPAVVNECIKVQKTPFLQALKQEWKNFESTVKKDARKVEKAL